MLNPLDAVAVAYTADDLLKILAEIGVLLTIFGGIVTNIIQTWYARKDVRKNTEVTVAGLTEVNKTAAVIEGHVNSQTTKLATEIDGLRNENAQLRTQLADTKQTAAVLASTVSHPAPERSGGRATDDLHPQIAANAAEIARNTAAIEALQNGEPKP